MATTEQLFAVADWHAERAIAAYLVGEHDIYTRHLAICDRLRHDAYKLKRMAA